MAKGTVFERFLWGFRYTIYVVVLGLLISSLIAFFLGINSTYEAFMQIYNAKVTGEHVAENEVLVYLISSIDEFLLGIILIIIALGIYELFISKLEMLNDKDIPYPSWLIFRSLEDLKTTLVKVIIIILTVYFFKNVVTMKFEEPLSILYLAAGIILVSLAHFLTHKQKEEKLFSKH